MPRKKLHWTQTPEGRKRARSYLAKASRASARNRKKGKKVKISVKGLDIREIKGNGNGSRPGIKKENEVVAYLFGQTEKAISDRARSAGVPYPVLARRVGKLLQQTSSGEVHGTRD